MPLARFEEDVFAALDRTWMDMHTIARATKVRDSDFDHENVRRYSEASGSGWQTTLDRLVEKGMVEFKDDPLAPMGKMYRRAL